MRKRIPQARLVSNTCPPRWPEGHRWWHCIVPVLMAMFGVFVLLWMFFNGGAIIAIAIMMVLAQDWE